jgi:hypothetical protein
MFCFIFLPGHNIFITNSMAGPGRNGALELFTTLHNQPFMLPQYGGLCNLLHVASAPKIKNISQGVILPNDNSTQNMLDMIVVVAISMQMSRTSTILLGLMTVQ